MLLAVQVNMRGGRCPSPKPTGCATSRFRLTPCTRPQVDAANCIAIRHARNQPMNAYPAWT